MEITLNNSQKEFILKEFGIDLCSLENVEYAQWEDIREKSFMIEAEEAPLDGANMNERCKTAVSIADTKYSTLFNY